ncbi:uncharacterized protein LOC132378494 [Hypanus sabinus]|uniref:uncharacterized protein LOC132378494 n=1 Tax=Hypanus sabinus TaxID=79690 RepID=UPI0028C39F6E|nr:uncharacterized protein LOC132378494 [Hypanus sabinus]XP_059801426.1 uncharacterized protein LOC132378494 [Hypanus sabinus]XP_059801427.1 uncharacterized protein LOC132378494 [Hypanus sabinus]XP_059801428.1 uncharacterized protein LOC132378494 [Hypanus sabinus]XP_059801429.1 uncharacterized protein LOC132378494 [Hypanus sabinus]XP_059801430.1 uncharacterized protein LOC132378494 [Hypanus sabinus]
MRDGFLNQHVKEPTREQAILDWVLSNEEVLVSNLVVRGPLGKSDHNMVEFFIKMESDIVNSETKVLNLKKGNFEGMRRKLAKIDWQMLLKGLTMDMQWQAFKDCMDELQHLFIPVCQKNKPGKVVHPWLTREIRDSIKTKEETYKLARKSGTPEDWEKFRDQQRRTKGLIRKGKKGYERKLAGNIKSDGKSFYRYVKRKRLVKTNVGPLQSETGELIMGNKDMADQLNNYFGFVFTKEDITNLLEIVGDRGSSEMEELREIHVSREVVLGKLKGLKADKSPGPDGLHPRVLKEVALVIIFQNSLDSGLVPEDWRVANVTPLFKKGGREKPGNSRPVSLPSVVGKMLESVIKDVITAHLESGEIIRQSQHGFVKGKSCLTNLTEFFEDVTSRVDRGEPVDVVYLNFQKAFDKVPHRRLVCKLKAHGIGGMVLMWIENWLASRK